jgi:hypothetical protein
MFYLALLPQRMGFQPGRFYDEEVFAYYAFFGLCKFFSLNFSYPTANPPTDPYLAAAAAAAASVNPITYGVSCLCRNICNTIP